MEPVAHSFPPVSQPLARVLVLGSMPGVASLEAQQYYGHAHNAFWFIVERLFSIERSLPYAERCAALAMSGVAVWDVLAACRRPGSLDADIERDSIVPNDLAGFLDRHGHVRALCFNGRKARDVFDRHIEKALPAALRDRVTLHDLPSTSPAYASISKDEKCERWAIVKDLAQS